MMLTKKAEKNRRNLEEQADILSAKAYRVVSRFVNDRHIAEDIIQDALLKAWNRIEQFDSAIAPLRVWVTQIAVNCARDYLRVQKRTDEEIFIDIERKFDLVDYIEDTNVVEPLSRLSYVEMARTVRESVVQLPEVLRETLQMYHFQDLGYRHIAQILGIPIGTVKSRLYLARQMLRPALTPLALEQL